MADISYTPTEKLTVRRPVNRIKYITNVCNNKNILDLGCFDETALVKEGSDTYLFDAISKVSAMHIGVDNSKLLPPEGLVFAENARILRGDIYDLSKLPIQDINFDVIIAGEVIEHLPNTLQLFLNFKKDFSGKRLVCSTPNATSFSNMLLSLFKRESAHIDHLQVYSFKTLNTLCRVAGFKSWSVIPYHVKFTEMLLRSGASKKQIVQLSENIINGIEVLFPMSSGGYIIDIEI